MTGTTLPASELGAALRRTVSVLLLGVAPVVVTVAVIAWTYGDSSFLSDFHGDLYVAGKAILAGRDPYRVAFLAQLAAVARAGGHPSNTFAVPVYPAPALLAATPLALLPYHLAAIVFTVLGVVALCLGLRLLGVRDWRCYGAAFLSFPVLHSLRLGQVNELLVLLCAVAWRWRPRALVCGCAVGAAVVAKVFLWPLGLFLVLSHRWRAAAAAAAFAAAVVLLAWAVLGFAGFSAYPRMLSDLSAVEGSAGISLLSLGTDAGLAHPASTALIVCVSALLVALAWLSLQLTDGKLGAFGQAGERSAFGLLIVAGITSSSLVWPHYLTLLFVPIALCSPGFGPLWLVPLLGYLSPVEATSGEVWRIVPYLLVELVVVGALCRPLLRARDWPLLRARRARSRTDTSLQAPGTEAQSPGGEEGLGRLVHGLRSTSFRSSIAAQRPTKGP